MLCVALLRHFFWAMSVLTAVGWCFCWGFCRNQYVGDYHKPWTGNPYQPTSINRLGLVQGISQDGIIGIKKKKTYQTMGQSGEMTDVKILNRLELWYRLNMLERLKSKMDPKKTSVYQWGGESEFIFQIFFEKGSSWWHVLLFSCSPKGSSAAVSVLCCWWPQVQTSWNGSGEKNLENLSWCFLRICEDLFWKSADMFFAHNVAWLIDMWVWVKIRYPWAFKVDPFIGWFTNPIKDIYIPHKHP